MMRWLKRIGTGILVLILLAVVGVGSVYAVMGRRLARRYPTKVEMVAIPTDSSSIERGRHLVLAVNKCVACHGDNLAGQKIADDPAFARLYSANLTSGNGGVAGGFTDADWVRAIRHGIGTDGRPLVMMPADSYYYMNDEDLGSVISYLRTVAPVDFVTPPRKIGLIARMLGFAGMFPLIPASQIPAGPVDRTVIAAGPTVEYGQYLSRIGGCFSCHGATLSGGRPVEGVKTANLTPTGLKSWSEADFIKTMRTGVRPGGRILSAVMPWKYVGRMNDDELKATWMYLQTLPPKKTGG